MGIGGEQVGVIAEVGGVGVGFAAERVNRAFRRRADGKLETLHVAVAELDGPHDGLGATQWLNLGSEGHHIGVVAAFDGLLGAYLDAGIAFPALFGLLIVGFHGMAGVRPVLVQFHQIVGADVDAGGFVLAFAAVAFVGTHICGHDRLPGLSG